ncbi:uncharacterized protein LOC144145756 isoform X4 [Haemaphysalis longicornis]
MSGDTKRKGKSNTSRPARSKVSQERKLEGIYNNARFVHVAASLVGHVVQVQVRDGELFEGVFRTVSPELEIVLETCHPVEPGAQGEPSSLSRLLASLGGGGRGERGEPQQLMELMIFRLVDVVALCAPNADLDFATRDAFATDAAISKFNGQLAERTLEPWMDGGTADGLDEPPLDGGEDTNGWDANEMFKTNEEKYGVQTSYDSALPSYTVQLEPKNTDEYKLQEAKASKIAQEIESNPVFKKRIEVENGDEEDKFSAVVRPAPDSMPQGTRYVRRKPLGGGSKPLRGTPPPSAAAVPSSAGGGLPRGGLPAFKGGPSPGPPPKLHHHLAKHPPPQHHPATAAYPEMDTSPRLNGAPSRLEKEGGPLSPGLCDVPMAEEVPPAAAAPAEDCPAVDKGPADRKGPPLQKGRVQEIEEFKKFSTSIKLDEGKESKDGTSVAGTDEETEKERKELDEAATAKEETDRLVKKSVLNPNAKEFVLNPNAKAFTPRTLLPLTSPPGSSNGGGGAALAGGVRLSSSPLVGVPPPPGPGGVPPQQVGPVPPQQLVPGQHIITMAPQYLMPATPVSVAQFAQGGGQGGPRFRKSLPLVQARHDLPASMHVAAATGQPILAPAGLPNAPQLMVQYTPAQGMMHPSAGPPQATVAYHQQAQCFGPLAQMYPMMGHRVMSPQPMGMVAATHTASYGDATHLPAQVYTAPLWLLPSPSPPVLQGAQGGGQAGGPHSSPPTPGGASTPVGQAGTPPVVYHPQPPPGGSGGPPPPPQANLVLVPHSGGANTPPHLLQHNPMVPPQLATHFVHHQVFPRLLPPGV